MLYYLDSTVNTDNPKGGKVEDRDNSEIGIYIHAHKCSPMAHTECDSGHTHSISNIGFSQHYCTATSRLKAANRWK